MNDRFDALRDRAAEIAATNWGKGLDAATRYRIAALRDRAQEVAEQRAPHEITDALARGDLEPQDVARMEDAHSEGWPSRRMPSTPLQVAESLMMIGVPMRIDDLAKRTLEERQAAEQWADTVRYNDYRTDPTAEIPVPERPEWLPGRDSDAARDAYNAEIAELGGYTAAIARYHTPYLAEPQPTFLEQLNELGDEDLITDLAAVGINVPEPTANDATQLQVFVSRLLQSAAYDHRDLAEQKGAEKLEHEIINNRYAEMRAPIERRFKRTVTLARQLAQNLNYGKRKSLELPYGKVGRTDHTAAVELSDADAALEWAITNRPTVVRCILDIQQGLRDEINALLPEQFQLGGTPKLDVRRLLSYADDSAEEIPGIVNVPARTEWYARPKLPPEAYASPTVEP